MPLEEPTNCWTTADKAIAEATAAADAFLAILAKVRIDAADAPQRVFGSQVGVPLSGDAYTVDELRRLRAFAQVFPGDSYGKQRTRTGLFHPNGQTDVVVQMLVDGHQAAVENSRGVEGSADAPTELEWFFQQRIGELVDNYIAAFQGDEELFLVSCTVTQPPGFNSKRSQDQRGLWIGAELTLEWGMGG